LLAALPIFGLILPKLEELQAIFLALCFSPETDQQRGAPGRWLPVSRGGVYSAEFCFDLVPRPFVGQFQARRKVHGKLLAALPILAKFDQKLEELQAIFAEFSVPR